MRLLIVGAGATVEETNRSGNSAAQPFPIIQNFASHWIVTGLSPAVHFACGAYLDSKGIIYNRKLLELFEGKRESLDEREGGNSPLEVFQKVAQENPGDHNVESVCEFVWHNIGQQNPEFWTSFAEHTVYLPLFRLQFEHFFENGVGWKQLIASKLVSEQLSLEDAVISLNYDTVFEIGLKQAGRKISYFPNVHPNHVIIYKPHGSLSLYVNAKRDDMYFVEPEEIYGTYHLPDERGGTFHPAPGIIPPRLNKSYAKHPISSWILDGATSIIPDVVTFWGIGLTTSDKDLEELYRSACQRARRIEFINPDKGAHDKACSVIGTSIMWFKTLGEWAAQ